MIYYDDLLDGNIWLFLLFWFEGWLEDLEVSLDHVDLFLDVLYVVVESLEEFEEILGGEDAVSDLVEEGEDEEIDEF